MQSKVSHLSQLLKKNQKVTKKSSQWLSEVGKQKCKTHQNNLILVCWYESETPMLKTYKKVALRFFFIYMMF